MAKIKNLILEKEKILTLVQFVIFLSLSILAPLFKIQFITGPIVNALLFLATVLLGSSSALLVGLLPSLISLSIGLLPFVLAPMIPFIMIGNAILVVTFNLFFRKNYWLGVVTASFLKFLFLFLSSQILVNFFLKNPLAVKVASMMGWPQFVTALTGGFIAYLFLKFLKKI
ncbi:MAG: iron hydrogenase [Patescibacteria group bacterium]|nr:iron hydrogenase [Patescibacteria group bacterium]